MSTTTDQPPSATTGITQLPTDILSSHILPYLDGQTLASATCTSTTLSAAAAGHRHLWSTICHSTWPSTATHQINNLITTFSDHPNRHNSFFSDSFPFPTPDPTTTPPPAQFPTTSPLPTELISAVDLHYKSNPIFTKTEVTETVSNWFLCSPFRIDLLDTKNTIPTQIPHPTRDTIEALMEGMRLSWILIDPVNKRSVNISSNKPVSVHRHWLSGDVQLRYVSVLPGDGGAVVQCRIVVNSGGSEDGKVQLREVTMEVEDMDGRLLCGRGSLVILHRVMEGKRGNGLDREEEGRRRRRRRYRRFEEMKRERRERKSRVERTLDILFLAFLLFIFVVLYFILFLRT